MNASGPPTWRRDAGELKLSEDDQRKLYDLIWKRTIASQMEAARLERTTVTIASRRRRGGLRATGQVVLFDGFLKVYEEGRDDVAEDDDGKRLPQVARRRAETWGDATPSWSRAATASCHNGGLGQQHFTQPPPRYTEATLVKRMEELGIGRPSTYASIVDTIQDRGYVRKDKGRLFPEDKGRLVTAFLSTISAATSNTTTPPRWRASLTTSRPATSTTRTCWRGSGGFSAAVARRRSCASPTCWKRSTRCWSRTSSRRTRGGHRPAALPQLRQGRLSMRTARSGGAFIGCSNYPECRYTRPFGPPGVEGDGAADGLGPDGKMLGVDPDSSQAVTLKTAASGPMCKRATHGRGAETAARLPAQGLGGRSGDGPLRRR
jgi:DNA topoisomerase-1